MTPVIPDLRLVTTSSQSRPPLLLSAYSQEGEDRTPDPTQAHTVSLKDSARGMDGSRVQKEGSTFHHKSRALRLLGRPRESLHLGVKADQLDSA